MKITHKSKKPIRKISYITEHEVIFRTPHKKTVKFDIYATTGSGHFFDIEMQKAGDTFFVDRTILNKAFLVIKAKIAKDHSKEFKALPKEEREKRRYELPETMKNIMAGKLVDARNKRSLEVAHNLYDMGKVSNADISAATGVPIKNIRRWKRKTV